MKFNSDIVILGLNETYVECGKHSFKIILNPKKFKNGKGINIKIIGPEHEDVDVNVDVWGRKLNCDFKINEEMINGVCQVRIFDENKKINKLLSFWVIK